MKGRKWLAVLLTLGMMAGSVAGLTRAQEPVPQTAGDPPGAAGSIRTKLGFEPVPAQDPEAGGWQVREAPALSPVETREVRAGQETFGSVADATVLQGFPTADFGTTGDMWVGYDHCEGAQIARSLVRFDLSSLPSDATIVQATLRLLLVNSCDMGERVHDVTAYRIDGSWSESSVTWNTKPGFAEAYGSASIPSRTWDWYSLDVIDLVQGWVGGSFPNHGLMLRGPESSGTDSAQLGFATRETDYAPELVVEYSSGNTPPTLSGLPDQQVPVNGSADNAIDLWAHASDAEDADADLIFTISNSPAPAAGVSLDANRYIDINPDPDWTGTTDVEIEVEDTGGLTDSDAFLVIVGAVSRVYLPLVVKQWPPTLETPVLNAIDNPDGDGNYAVSWSAVASASTYTLEEDDNGSFSSPITAYSGSGTSAAISGRDVGMYYYRVKASSASTSSGWSNIQSVEVTVPPAGPAAGHYTGTPSLSFDVTTDGRVCEFDIRVPFQSSTCHVVMHYCVPIMDNGFEFTEGHPDFGVVKRFTGTFDTRTHVTGDYAVVTCGNTLITPPSTGTFEASKQAEVGH
jgi:hypothetical protein